ncbi:MAG: metallophosphoesterase [Actinobacteria bacterium]|nr:metallophosphoesterase [Actinomycetota bacterium]
MRLAVFADLHLDRQFSWAGPDLARRRRQALRDVARRIAELAVSQRCDALCCAGDLYEQERFSSDTGALLRQLFADLSPMPVLLAPGNHDWYGPASLYQTVEWTPNVTCFTGQTLEPKELCDGLTIWGSAHGAPSGTRNFLEGFTVGRGGVNLALFHGSEVSGLPYEGDQKIGHAPFKASEIVDSGLRHALVGHYHGPRDEDDYTYPGNPDPLTFGESGERGVVIVDLDEDGTVQRSRHRVAISQVHEVEVDVGGSETRDEVRARVREALHGLAGCARVNLTGEVAPQVVFHPAELQSLDVGLDAVFVGTVRLEYAYDLDEVAAEHTVRGQFCRDVHDSDLTDDEKERVIVTGLRAFDARDDLEVD